MHNSAKRGVAIGFFDGVHLGHQRILSSASIAITFENHPLSILASEKAPRLIMPFAERRKHILACGIEKIVALRFDARISRMNAEDFVAEVIAPLGEKRIVCGSNWKFGRGGKGDGALLSSLGYEVEVAPMAEFAGERVSSTRIRAAIESGELDLARSMLSRPWKIFGRICRGKGLGAKIGSPTVNLIPENLFLNPPRGVYSAKVGSSRAVVNFGLAPTLGDKAWKSDILEVHFLDSPVEEFDGVEIYSFLRPEKKFDSIESLKEQISLDKAAAKRALDFDGGNVI